MSERSKPPTQIAGHRIDGVAGAFIPPTTTAQELLMDRRTFLALATSAAVPLGAGAASPTEQARMAATDWLRLVDSGELDASWTQAASMFKQAVTVSQWVLPGVADGIQNGDLSC
jgi:hypothetical protein